MLPWGSLVRVAVAACRGADPAFPVARGFRSIKCGRYSHLTEVVPQLKADLALIFQFQRNYRNRRMLWGLRGCRRSALVAPESGPILRLGSIELN